MAKNNNPKSGNIGYRELVEKRKRLKLAIEVLNNQLKYPTISVREKAKVIKDKANYILKLADVETELMKYV